MKQMCFKFPIKCSTSKHQSLFISSPWPSSLGCLQLLSSFLWASQLNCPNNGFHKVIAVKIAVVGKGASATLRIHPLLMNMPDYTNSSNKSELDGFWMEPEALCSLLIWRQAIHQSSNWKRTWWNWPLLASMQVEIATPRQLWVMADGDRFGGEYIFGKYIYIKYSLIFNRKVFFTPEEYMRPAVFIKLFQNHG